MLFLDSLCVCSGAGVFRLAMLAGLICAMAVRHSARGIPVA
jgi:hypothetical protein